MISKNKIKFIQSLEQKKNRTSNRCFIAEGNKLVQDTIGHFHCKSVIATKEWIGSHDGIQADEIICTTNEEIRKASLLKSPQEVLAIYEQPQHILNTEFLKSSLSIVLDTVQDPGNLGTIVRIADWFGITDIICSPDSADIYNPKTVQATMGAIARVKVHYTPLDTFLSTVEGIPVYGTFLDGQNMYDTPLSPNGIIIMGNEGNGISSGLESFIDHRLYIPSYPPQRETSESLNVAIATAIVCAEFRRRI